MRRSLLQNVRGIPNLEHDHIKTITEIVVCDARTKQLTRTFTETTTHLIQIPQMCLADLRLAPLAEIG